ncbi:unnamed protein product [Calypogeia fissa]
MVAVVGSDEGTEPILSIEPTEVKFPFQPREQASAALRLVNLTDEVVAFKIKTTSQKMYIVRPKVGTVMPKSGCNVIITMQAQMKAPPGMLCKDKFMVQSVVVPLGSATSAEDVSSQELFNKELTTIGNAVHEEFLGVRLFVAPTPQPPSSQAVGATAANQPPGACCSHTITCCTVS